MLVPKSVHRDEKLAALRKGDPRHDWKSLDQRLSCVLCEKTFSGSQIEVSVNSGRVRLHCPSEGCPGTPSEWVYPGNPLISPKAWRDWERILRSNQETHPSAFALRPAAFSIL